MYRVVVVSAATQDSGNVRDEAAELRGRLRGRGPGGSDRAPPRAAAAAGLHQAAELVLH